MTTRVLFWIAAAFLFENSFCHNALCLDPHKKYAQYLRSEWTLDNGSFRGRINSIAQTADGYLWIATSNGLVRFDGFTFVSSEKLNHATEPISQALTLVSDKDGSLWIWEQGQTVLRYNHGRFEDLRSLAGFEHGDIAAISRSNEGGLLAATLGPQIFRYGDGKVTALTGQHNLSIASPQTIAETSDGKIWMATFEEGLSYWEHGKTTALKEGVPDSKINCMLPVENSGLWIGTDNGLVFWDGKKIVNSISARSLQQTRVLSLAQDRDGNIWIGTSGGLFRLNSEGLTAMQPTQKASTRAITAIFEDSEANLWVGDAHGIERVRDGTFSTYSAADGLPREDGGPICVDSANRAWTAPAGGGLYKIANGAINAVDESELGRDVIYSIAGAGKDLWVGRRAGGLTHLVIGGDGQPDAVAVRTYTHAEGLAQNSVSSVFVDEYGAIWTGTLSGGVSRLKDGKFVTFTSADGLGSNTVSSIQDGADGAMWFATSNGLSQFSKGKWKNYTARNGLPSDELTTLFRDSSGVLWIGTSDGLAYLSSDVIRSVADVTSLLSEAILGIVEDGRGSLWLTTSDHVLRVSRSGLLKGRLNDEDRSEYGVRDGLASTEGVRRDRSVVSDPGGNVWLSTTGGVSKVDLKRLTADSPPAPPQVSSIVSDGQEVKLDDPVTIAAAPQRITISYIAVSLAIPERVLYRYKLEGFDHTWSAPTDARQVVYTNLGPGSYRFALIASNGNGPWKGAETDLPIMIKPTLWQTWWFELLLVTAALGMFWLFYLYRLEQATARIQDRLDAQLEERVRIARELHDTLLQGFQGLMLRLHAVLKVSSPQEPVHKMIEQVLDRADQVLLEGRDSVKDLRQAGATGNELSEVLRGYGDELSQGTSVLVTMTVVGNPQTLGQIVFNETTRIAREALINCFQHAQPSNIEVEIAYSRAEFCLRIRDDGVGIEAAVVQQGREGHWGLSGMRERAQKIGGKLSIWTNHGAGTEIELTVPARVAYTNNHRRSLWSRFRKRAS
jgi:signal transduction histidine kinase/ligand-binding sensor domain-containing protein